MTKENNSNINKLNVTLGQTKSVQQKEFLSLSAADYEERLLKEALDQPRKEEERAREKAVKHLTDQINGCGIAAKLIADQESEHKRQIEIIVKQLSGTSPRDIELKESLYKKTSIVQAFEFFSVANKSLFELNKHSWTSPSKQKTELEKDFDRARRLLEFADEFNVIEITEGLTKLENELQANGALTSRQLFFLIAISKVPDFIPRMQAALKVARKNAAKNKKERANEYHSKWRKWADETLKANPIWNQEKIAKHVLETATKEGHKMANGKPYKVGTVLKEIRGHRKALI